MSTTPKAHAGPAPDTQFVEIDGEELALRIAEAVLGMKPPPYLTVDEAMANLTDMDSDAAAGFRRAAKATVEYLSKCMGTHVVKVSRAEGGQIQ